MGAFKDVSYIEKKYKSYIKIKLNLCVFYLLFKISRFVDHNFREI